MSTFEHIQDLIRRVHRNPRAAGVLSTGESCAVALWFGKPELAHGGYDKDFPFDALQRVGADWEFALRQLWQSGWRPEDEVSS